MAYSAAETLTPERWQVLASIVDALTPGSAVTCACVQSLERKLQGPLARLTPAFSQGLDAVECTCRQQTGCSILDLEPGVRKQFVRELRCGHKLTAFFGLVTSACALRHLSS